MKFREGDRVLLTSNARGYSIGKGNPLVGTPYECPGYIRRIAGVVIQVYWDNGHKNSYRSDDLSPVGSAKLEPNWAFRIKRIDTTPKGRKCHACGWNHLNDVTRCSNCGTEGDWLYIYRCEPCGNELHTKDINRCRSVGCGCGRFNGWTRLF